MVSIIIRKVFSRLYNPIFVLALILCFLFPVHAKYSFFTYSELTTLYEENDLETAISNKLHLILTTPIVSNNNIFARKYSHSDQIGDFIRIAHWNIERGIEVDVIKAMLTSDEELRKVAKIEKKDPEKKLAELLAEAAQLRNADVIVLNEVDLGLKRSGYRDVAKEIADVLGMNYAYGTQFIELAPIHVSMLKQSEDTSEKEVVEKIGVDKELYKGMHGLAILSRFPLENVRLIPFESKPYDWFLSEKNGPSIVEKGKRALAKQVFLEETMREVRRGGRSSLLADIVDDRLPSGRVTIAATHLENRTDPAHRVVQFNELLETIKDISNPVIVAGDMNTSGSDFTPTSIKRELVKRFGDPKYWARQAVNYAFGLGVVEDVIFTGVTFGRNQGDPTVKHIPFIAPNPERKFFDKLKNYRFDDGGAFDLRGDKSRSTGKKSKPFANSNQRSNKGFITTYQVKRPIVFVGKYKLDWIFVKPGLLKDPFDKNGSYNFAPHFGRTLMRVNEAIEDRISDHRPIIVDLPLESPVQNLIP